jgi:signal transduction histidine kinase
VKFTDTGDIKIATSIEGKTLRVCVSDTGIGIKPENIRMLFEAFRQVDGSSKRIYEGTGLGLYLCRTLLSLMGGKISVESEFGKGSRFTFTVPMI